ncbi:hypothetical protein HHK36_024019 [Tetracentron sinense]|uniref:Phosphofructokinase domain-containing protein n=1 Tax=Tetracentron sinense TaxID=13715 RepID=A0A834YR78_TETSI|nr:hypothetical protein HHK36_024019 [Tetracentron sinense]
MADSKPENQKESFSFMPINVQNLTHLTDYLPNLQTFTNPLEHNQFYHPSDGFYISPSDVIPRDIVYDLSGTFPETSPQLAYHRAGPRKQIFFDPSHVRAAIVTCGGLCPGLNTVIRELVVGLWDLYGVRQIFGVTAGYRGFYTTEPVPLNPKMVHNWHKRGGTVLVTSRGGFDLEKIVNAIEDRGFNQVVKEVWFYFLLHIGNDLFLILSKLLILLAFNSVFFAGRSGRRLFGVIRRGSDLDTQTETQSIRLGGSRPPVAVRFFSVPSKILWELLILLAVNVISVSSGGSLSSPPSDSSLVYIIGGDGTLRGAVKIFDEICRRKLNIGVSGIPKTVDNDVGIIDRSFGFQTAVETAQQAINAAHVEAESAVNGIGLVKLMGRSTGHIALHATLSSRDVDCCLIPENEFYLEGKGGLFDFLGRRLKENGHAVVVVAEGAGQDMIPRSAAQKEERDESGNPVFLDVGGWLKSELNHWWARDHAGELFAVKYIDPTYMIRAVPANATDNLYCTLLAHSAIHGVMAGYTGFVSGPVNGNYAYIPVAEVAQAKNVVNTRDHKWAWVRSITNQPDFVKS